MRMSNEDFTKQVLMRGDRQIQHRKQVIRNSVTGGAVLALIVGVIGLPVFRGSRSSYTATDAAMESQTIIAENDNDYAAGEASSEAYEAYEEECAEDSCEAESSYDESAAKNSDRKKTEDYSAVGTTGFRDEKTEDEIFAYYGITGLPEQIGDMQLMTERSEDIYSGGEKLSIGYADPELTVPYDDYNLWVYSQDGGTQTMRVLLGKAQDGDDDTVVYAESEDGGETAAFSNGFVSVLLTGYGMTHDEFAAAAEELKAALAQAVRE